MPLTTAALTVALATAFLIGTIGESANATVVLANRDKDQEIRVFVENRTILLRPGATEEVAVALPVAEGITTQTIHVRTGMMSYVENVQVAGVHKTIPLTPLLCSATAVGIGFGTLSAIRFRRRKDAGNS